MRIIISDSSCLIDLRKASLLAVFLRLPFEILIPNTLFEDELLSFTDGEKKMLLRGGLKVVDLPGSQVSRAREVIRTQPRLSIHDGFAFALAEVNHGCILLTGDSLLRVLEKLARSRSTASSGSSIRSSTINWHRQRHCTQLSLSSAPIPPSDCQGGK